MRGMNNKISNLAKNFTFKHSKEDDVLTYKRLTVMSNLSAFEERLNKELKKSKKNSKEMAFLFFDSDNFNNTNDILSFDNNDEFIETISKKYEEYIENTGILYRFSESKFVIIIYNIYDIDDFKNNLEEILKNLDELTEITDNDIYNSANVGISIYPNHGDSTKELINNAKIAMYKSKELGKNKYCFFENSIYKEMVNQKELLKDLKNALKNNEFVIHYQPQVDTQINKIYGVEALLRWNSAKHGYMPPNKFIPIAEKSGVIVEIGEWVLRQVCIQAKRWQESGLNIKISINISAIQLEDKYFFERVKNIFSETNVDPNLIDFEITESILIQSTEEVKRVLTELKNMGIKIALDDFGTGYSSLIYLNTFPLDTIKIDRSFITDSLTSFTKPYIIEGIVYMAKNIGMNVIAEGIENEEELEFIIERDCNKIQGYLFSKPLPIDEIEAFIIRFN